MAAAGDSIKVALHPHQLWVVWLPTADKKTDNLRAKFKRGGWRMGSVKEHWLMTRPDHEVSFTCPECGARAAGYVRAPSIEGSYREDDFDEDQAEVDCPKCKSSWTVEMRADINGLAIQVFEYPDVDVTASPLDFEDDDWRDDPPPEPDAYSTFEAAMQEWRILVGSLASETDGSASENRMLFTHLFSIVEAYLSDSVIGLAMNEHEVQSKIIKVLPTLKGKTVSLDTLAKNPNILRDMVESALQDVSFHNLTNVNTICNAALGKPLLPKAKEDRDLLVASVQIRHDCVHRNGRATNGKRHDTITHTFLGKLGKLFKQMAKELNENILEFG